MHGIFNKYINDSINYINGNYSILNITDSNLLSRKRTCNEDCDNIMQINQIVKPMDMGRISNNHLHVWRHSVMVVASTRYPLHKVQVMWGFTVFSFTFFSIMFTDSELTKWPSLWLTTSNGCTSTLYRGILSLQLDNK